MKLYIAIVLCAFVCQGLAVPSWYTFWSSYDSDDSGSNEGPIEDITTECLNLGNWGQCAFYDCLERRFPCGRNGYTEKISKHFCKKIDDNYEAFDEIGKEWLNKTSECLIKEYMVPLYRGESTTCDDIKSEGINSIVYCNDAIVNGRTFCDFTNSNSDAYMGLMGSHEMALMASLRDHRVFTSMVTQAVRCGVGNLRESINEMYRSVSNTASDLASRFGSLFSS